MLVFLVLGSIGLLLLALSLVADGLDLPDVAAVDLDAAGGTGLLPILAAALAAFGFGGALLLGTTSAGSGLAALGGAGAAALVGRLSVGAVRSLVRTSGAPTPTVERYVGSFGVVVTGVPPDGLGEVTVRQDGTLQKFSARSDEPLALGTEVCVVETVSPTCLKVRRLVG